FWLATDLLGIACAVRLAERVAARDERDGFFVVHGHAREGLANIVRRCQRIRIAVRSLRIHVNQAHLHGCERLLQIARAAVALITEPRALGSPGDVFFGLPNVGTSTRKAKGLEAHGLERDVAGEYHQVAPRELLAVLLLDRPKQAARL